MFDFGQRNAFGHRGGGASNAGGQNPHGLSSAPNATGGKAIIKYNPSNADTVAGIKAQSTLFTWQSPDGDPHFVTIDVGRVVNGYGGPGQAAGPGDPLTGTIGGIAGATFPQCKDLDPNSPTFLSPYYYRPYAQIVLGTPGTMQDPFFIDINRGQRFSACVSYVAVTAAMAGPPLDDTDQSIITPGGFGGRAFVSGSIAVYATLGVGITPSLAPVLYTQYIDLNSVPSNPAQYGRIIPPRANALLAVQSSFSGDTLNVILKTPTEVDYQSPTFNNGEMGVFGVAGIPISNEDTFVQFGSIATASSAQRFKLIYQISV